MTRAGRRLLAVAAAVLASTRAADIHVIGDAAIAGGDAQVGGVSPLRASAADRKLEAVYTQAW